MKTAPLALLFLLSCSEPAPHLPAQLKVDAYLGAEPALYLESGSLNTVAVALPDVAGRLVNYSRDGQNILWNNPDPAGKPRPGGGFGLDLGPERTIPPHPVLWNQKYTWAKFGATAFTLTSGRDAVSGIRIEKQLAMNGDTGALDLVHRMRNISDRPQAWCFWDRTLVQPGGFCVIPLNPKSRFPSKWVLGTRKGPVWWEYNADAPSHPAIKVLDGMLVSKSQGKEQKMGADSDAGWIAYMKGRLLFVKYYPYKADGAYVDNGLSVAHYFNENLAELEPLSPEAKLAVDGEYVFPEHWTLTRLAQNVTTHEEARQVAASIPPSPF